MPNVDRRLRQMIGRLCERLAKSGEKIFFGNGPKLTGCGCDVFPKRRGGAYIRRLKWIPRNTIRRELSKQQSNLTRARRATLIPQGHLITVAVGTRPTPSTASVAGIRRPSRDYPYSLLVHCRTAEHVANVFKVDVLLLKRAAKALKGGSNPENLDAIPFFDDELIAARKNRKPQVHRVWKIVAKDGDHYVSVYDDSEWALGVTRHEIAQSGHGGGYYWYPSLEETLEAAESNVVFNQAWCRGKHLVVLECEAWGRVIAYESGKRASSNLKPLHQVLDLGCTLQTKYSISRLSAD